MKSVVVSPERLESWLAGFAERHAGMTYVATPELVTATTESGVGLECVVPFPPMRVDPTKPYDGLIEHVRRDRRVGVILVRRGGYGVGVFQGRRLVRSKVGSRYVQGRTAAGGWSQQRFARRREQQARELYAAAAEVAGRLLLPEVPRLEAIVLGGDRRGTGQVLEAKQLAPLRQLVTDRHIDVPDPKLTVLKRTPESFRSVLMRIHDERS